MAVEEIGMIEVQDMEKAEESPLPQSSTVNLADEPNANIQHLLTDLYKRFSEDEEATERALYDGFLVAYNMGESRREIAKRIAERDSSDDGTQTLFRSLIKEKPYIAGDLLNDCYHFYDESNQKYIKFDYKFLEEPTGNRCSGESKRNSNHTIHVLELLKDDPESDLLLHPVITSLLSWKWWRYIALFYFINLGFFSVYLGFLTAFALLLPNPEHNLCSRNGSNATESTMSSSCGVLENKRGFIFSAAIVIIVLSSLRILMEIFRIMNVSKVVKMFSRKKRNKGMCNSKVTCKTYNEGTYFKTEYYLDPSNYLEIPLYILSIAFALVYANHCFCASHIRWQIGTVTVFLAWMDLILYLNKWPLFGVYIEMLWRIARRFFNVLLIAFLLLFAFALAFYMTFHKPHRSESPFQNMVDTFVTIITFAINGPDVNLIMLYNEDSYAEDSIAYPILSHILWINFGAVVSFLFTTFLVGLAVHDVSKLQKQADKKRSILMIHLFRQIEELINYCNFLTRLFCRRNVLPAFLNKRSPQEYNLKCNSCYVQLAFFWGDEIKSIVKKAQQEKKRKHAKNMQVQDGFKDN